MATPRGNRRLERAVFGLAGAVVAAFAAERLYDMDLAPASFASAGLALALCCYVVFLSAPQVIKWVRKHEWTLPWNYRITPQGLIFVAAIVVLAVTAMSSGNNLIYLVLSSMLAAVLLSELVSRLVLPACNYRCRCLRISSRTSRFWRASACGI